MRILILDSLEFSHLGWVTEPATQQRLVDSLERAEVEVAVAEVAGAGEVAALLAGVGSDTLIWPNVYCVRTEAGSRQTVWLADLLEARGVPIVGSPAPALRAMLHKDHCQARLAAAGVPIPRFTVVRERDAQTLADAVEAAELGWPVVVKPTSTAGSVGISMAGDLDGLAALVGRLLDDHGPRVLVEEFLPSADVTVAALPAGPETVVLPTWYEIADRDPGSSILDRRDRLRPWGDGKRMRAVEEAAVLEQIKAVAPRIVDELGIRDVTRFDGRLDRHGVLRVFDVNGMPALDYPDAVILRQVTTIWRDLDALAALDRLVCSLVASAADRCRLAIPRTVKAGALARRAASWGPGGGMMPRVAAPVN
jgi:D-alanine-D-alanine ligase